MDKDTLQVIAIAIITLCQLYAEGNHVNLLAMTWDAIASFCERIAGLLGYWGLQARNNYYRTVSSYGA